MLEKGDTVVMENCGEAKHYEGVIWTCRTGEQELCGSQVVWLEDFSGAFAAKYLRKIDVDEATVTCSTCEKKILHDSQGYYFDGLTGKYSCNKCYEKEIHRLKVQQELDAIEITHTVFKNSDIEKAAKEFSSRVKTDLEGIAGVINHVRKDEGRSQNPRYIVINTDEDPRMIEEIIKVMKRYRKWG